MKRQPQSLVAEAGGSTQTLRRRALESDRVARSPRASGQLFLGLCLVSVEFVRSPASRQLFARIEDSVQVMLRRSIGPPVQELLRRGELPHAPHAPATRPQWNA